LRTSHRSPPFPYTTLFRSRLELGAGRALAVVVDELAALERHALLDELAVEPLLVGELGATRLVASLSVGVRAAHLTLPCRSRAADRKSTRLNSSHVKISYA